ncbi:reticulocalbin-2-like [Oppia nitens]|uniref:reticulocalbin-2-like n=1 Tax=Oppia nitens TaxID=1686743 RepID=UPI0023DA2134|nr:reticulocalbin-2-like [Oppia nitens]
MIAIKVILLSLIILITRTITILCTPHIQLNKERIEDAFGDHLSDKNADNQHNGHHFDHEAVLGSKDTAKEFDQMSAEESKRRLRVLVKSGMDVNGDGFVDKQELIDWILKSFKTLAIEDGNERLEEEDLNKDGVVSWDEHLKDSFDIEEDVDDNQLLKDEVMAEDKALWKAADINGDNVLDSTEFAAFNSPEEFEQMHQTIYDLMMTKRDRNKNGFLEIDEFVSDVNGRPLDPKSEHYLVEKDRFHNEYDLDHDNRLNKKECLLWLIPNNYEMSESEANHLISLSDDNRDERLSIDEIVDHHDVFVGSEVTDFGQNLENVRLSDEL